MADSSIHYFIIAITYLTQCPAVPQQEGVHSKFASIAFNLLPFHTLRQLMCEHVSAVGAGAGHTKHL